MFEQVYGLNHSILSFAVANDFVKTMNKGCYQLGGSLQPFCVLGGKEQANYGVSDIAFFEGLVDKSKTIIQEVAEYRYTKYREANIIANIGDVDTVRALFIDYLLSISICYIEIPKYVTKEGVPQQTYDKFLATKNPSIMAMWMGCTPNEMQLKYSAKVQTTQISLNSKEVRVVKLNSATKGNSITCPRSGFATDKMSCTPLFALHAFIKGVEPMMRESIVKFTYLKDNNTFRELNTTLSHEIMLDYYKEQSFVNRIFSNVAIFDKEQGGMTLSSKQTRGYVTLPEIGASRYDSTGTRALNLARILRVERVLEVDRTFIDVDLDSVEVNFSECVDYMISKMPDQLSIMYQTLSNETVTDTSVIGIAQKSREFVKTRTVILSTTFKRALHVFLVNNPQWFPLYTGKPNTKVESSANFGVGTMDF